MKRILHVLAVLWLGKTEDRGSPKTEDRRLEISKGSISESTSERISESSRIALMVKRLSVCTVSREVAFSLNRKGERGENPTSETAKPRKNESAIILLALFMCLLAAQLVSGQTEPAAAGRDTVGISKDTLQIDEVEINAGYYTVKDRERTGSIGRVDAKTIARQPVSNPLAALHGQIPGVEVTQQSGAPGATVSLRIRGQNSLINGSDPLYIIDGVPFMAGQTPLNNLSNAASNSTRSQVSAGISPLSMFNPSDIVSIEILKDADATAIYGSRGANGVVLITTRMATSQATTIDVQYRTGLSRPARVPEILSGDQYLMMRREAYANDGIDVTPDIAPDLMVWDTTEPTVFASLLLPENAQYNDAKVSVQGGNGNANFFISGSYHDESTVFDKRTANRRAGINAAGTIRNLSGNFGLTGTVNLSNTRYDIPMHDATRYLRYFPFFRLYNDDGTFAWDIGGTPYRNLGFADGNPLARQHRGYNADLFNMVGQVSAHFRLAKGLNLKADFGTVLTFNNEWSASPSAALDPYTTILPSATFSNSKTSGWTVEPQLNYTRNTKWGEFSALMGATWQHQQWDARSSFGTNYSSDILLGTIAGAGNTTNQDQNTEYRYQGWYARLNAKFRNRYIINLTGRRDGSSRFSPENRYTTFAAVGAAWLLDKERFMQWAHWLNDAKLRASYGVTGNDQIGDYQYVDTWSTGFYTYEGITGMNPLSLYNPNYVWERNRKAEVGFESSLFQDRVRLQVAYFRNVSDNQLVRYTLPDQTGFANVLRNHQAEILNAGWEISFGHQTAVSKPMHWQTTVNVTLPKNELLGFPDLESSSYRNRYIIGEAITTRRGYQYLGVNPETGLYDYVDVDGNGIFNTVDAIFPVRNDIQLYGGWTNTITFKQWSLSSTLDFKLQDGYNYLYSTRAPGYGYSNHPVYVLNRWQKPGDQAPVQRFTASQDEAYQRAQRLDSSAGVISDASYARLRNLALMYALPTRLTAPLGVASCRLSIQGQNLFTFTSYEGTDPENQDYYVLPPLRSVVLSIELSF